MALVTLSRATELVPNWQSTDNALMQDILNACSDVVVRYCNRDFVLTTYDELYDGTGTNSLLLNQYPVVQVQRCGYGSLTVLSIRQTDNGVSRASIRLDGDNASPPNPAYVYLQSYKNGVPTTLTIGPLTSSTPTVVVNGGSPTTIAQLHTFDDLAGAINTYGTAAGWLASGFGNYGSWPVADLRPPQGAFEAARMGQAFFRLHAFDLPALEVRPEVGEIVAPTGFSRGYNNVRVVYQAGYATVPQPVQQAVAALAVSVYMARGQNANLASENLGGYSYANIVEKNFHSLDIASRYSLSLYKNFRVAKDRA